MVKRKYTDEQKKTVLDLFNQGYSKNEIAKKTGLSYYFVVISTPKIHNGHYLSDKAVVILKQLNEKGYYFPKSVENTIQYVDLRNLCQFILQGLGVKGLLILPDTKTRL